MRIKIWPGHASLLQDSDWLQMSDWLAGIRDDGRAGPAGDDHEPAGDGRAGPASRSGPRPGAPAGAAAPAQAAARPVITVRAVIGDQLRMPVMWCEMGSCISWHADPAALGEADARARAIGAGWRIDALGRLACPRCQRADPGFWATGPVVPWDRYTAIARAARAAAVPGDSTPGAAAGGSSRDPGPVAGGRPCAGPPEPGWHQPGPPSPRRWP